MWESCLPWFEVSGCVVLLRNGSVEFVCFVFWFKWMALMYLKKFLGSMLLYLCEEPL